VSPVVAKSTKATPAASVKFSGGSVAAGIGYSWASGTLTYKGKAHKLKVEGLSVGDVGASNIEATGSVYHLKQLSDFPGTYAAVGAAATAGGGGGVMEMKNQNGVVIKATTTSRGLELKLGTDGVKIELAK
jgi:hypothetical protein